MPWLVAEVEATAHRVIRLKAQAEGALVHAVGGTEDHVHLVVSVPPRVPPAAFIGKVKGATSYHLRRMQNPVSGFAWQNEYGVVSISERDLSTVIRYVESQKERHAARRLVAALEPRESRE